MDTIKTEPIQLVGRVRSFRRTVRIRQESEVRVVGDNVTEVQIPIKPEFSEKEFTEVRVRPLGAPAADSYARLMVDQVTIVLKGPLALLDKLQPSEILAYAEVEGLKEGIQEIPVRLVLPPDLALRDEAPRVTAEVRKLKF